VCREEAAADCNCSVFVQYKLLRFPVYNIHMHTLNRMQWHVVMCYVTTRRAVTTAGGLGPMLSAPSQFGPGMPLEGKFWQVAVPAVTANVGYWATLSLNIPDFSRCVLLVNAALMCAVAHGTADNPFSLCTCSSTVHVRAHGSTPESKHACRSQCCHTFCFACQIQTF
jgi:hypothetical protein